MASPLVNGARYSHVSVTTTIDGVKYIRGIKAIDYKVNLEPGQIYGSSRLPQGATIGQAKYEASFEMYEKEFCDMTASMGDGFMALRFNIQVERSEKNSAVVVDRIDNVSIKSWSGSTSEGSTDAHTVKVELDVLGPITKDGVKPVLDLSEESI